MSDLFEFLGATNIFFSTSIEFIFSFLQQFFCRFSQQENT